MNHDERAGATGRDTGTGSADGVGRALGTGAGRAIDRTEPDRASATRDRLAEAATTAFAEKGFAGTTTRDIAAAAGMSPAALYVHHRSKEELLYIISKAGHLDALRTVRSAAASSDDPATALRALVHDYALQHARGSTRARIVNYELGSLTPEHFTEIRELRHDIENEVRALVGRGITAGVFDTPDRDFAAVALLSLGIDIARWYRAHGRWSPETVARGYAEMALRIVGCRAAREPVTGQARTGKDGATQ